jgi:hypothetical protein
MEFLELMQKYKFLQSNGSVNPQFKNKVRPLFSEEEEQAYSAALGIDCVEKVYCALHDIKEVPVCKQCGKPLIFDKQIKRYREYCSNRCSSLGKAKKQDSMGAHNPIIQKKMRDTCTKKYGVDSYSKTAEFKQKIKNSFLKSSLKTIDNIQCGASLIHFSSVYEESFWKCDTCGKEFSHIFGFSGFLNTPLCPHCQPKYARGKGERLLAAWLKEEFPNEEIIINTRKIIPPKELDIYLPKRNFAIEFNELAWHCENDVKGAPAKNKTYHQEKTNQCQSLGITLFHIWDSEWRNKTEILKSMIRAKLGKFESVYARKCDCRMISTEIARSFLDRNHIQGFGKGTYKYGLFYQDELVSVLVLSEQSFCKGTLEIIRFASKLNHRVVGGFSKLWSFFLKQQVPFERIVSYADKRYFNGAINSYAGLSLKGANAPIYSYTKNYRDLYHRMNFSRKKIQKNLQLTFNPSLTEWENMQANGYNRIWDCGQNIWELIPAKQ